MIWPKPAAHPELAKHAVHIFDVLRQNLLKKHGHQKNAKKQAELEALFIWSASHGLDLERLHDAHDPVCIGVGQVRGVH
jgi:hypothetical protein